MSNHVEHHTNAYNWNFPIYRRGFPIHLSSNCDDCEKIQSVSISIRTGRATSGPAIKDFNLVMGYEVNGWRIRYSKTDDKSSVNIILNSSPRAIVGKYSGSIYINGKLRQSIKFLLFFNPWCRDDLVYLDEDDKRQEYILNTHTIIYMGTMNHISSHGWYLAQFQSASIEAVLMILDRMNVEDRSSPIKVSRFFSALVNANDDNGIVTGNWSGEYAGGISPLAWTGSNNILSKYVKRRIPVKYGQCWVFCGVLCTILRTVGIPARCITTYNSFHDHDGSLAWEMYYNKHMQPMNFRRQESMWNFHCWNEAWMDRKDLPIGNSGWQVVDSTPQERSQGIFRCGPVSKNAIKDGNVELHFDTGFVFAEVNADKIFYHQKANGQFVVGKVDSYTVGRSISCKAVGSNKREDLTLTYKYPDNSQIDRIIQNKINNQRRRNRNIVLGPIQVEINPSSCASFKKDCLVNLKITNRAKIKMHIKFRVIISIISYRGRITSTLFNQMYETNIEALTDKPFQEIIKAENIRKSIINDVISIKIEVNGMTNAHDFIQAETVFDIEGPKINIYGVPSNMLVGQKYRLKISILNPIDHPLNGVKLNISGDVILNGKYNIHVGVIESNKSYEGVFEVSSRFPGIFYIYSTLQSYEMSGFESHVSVNFNIN